MTLKSDTVTEGTDRAASRALLYATGLYGPEDRGKPLIGIANAYNDLIPGHVHMRRLERAIEKGVAEGGGVAFNFGIPGICDGLAMGHGGMRYSLPSRELIADSVETVAQAHQNSSGNVIWGNSLLGTPPIIAIMGTNTCTIHMKRRPP